MIRLFSGLEKWRSSGVRNPPTLKQINRSIIMQVVDALSATGSPCVAWRFSSAICEQQPEDPVVRGIHPLQLDLFPRRPAVANSFCREDFRVVFDIYMKHLQWQLCVIH